MCSIASEPTGPAARRRGPRVRARVPAVVLGLAALAAGCSGQEAAAPPAAPPPVQIGKESVTRVQREEIRTGPRISGQLVAERSATVRAEVGGSVELANLEEGQAVRQGAVLARIAARDLTDARESARVGVASAEAALALAQSEARRTAALVEGGALARRELDNAQNAVTNAQSQVAAARARLSSAETQLADTVVRSPIAGLVSDKAVNAGDVVSPGTALYTIVDPSSMRLEASVPSEKIMQLRRGAPVQFTVRGYDAQTFTGTIERISPTADPATRQVPIWVSIPNAGGRLIAGLYAEGRIETEKKEALVVPGTAIDAAGGSPSVTRVREGKAERVPVTLGLTDADTERVEVTDGLQEGDTLLVGAARGITPGTPVAIPQ